MNASHRRLRCCTPVLIHSVVMMAFEVECNTHAVCSHPPRALNLSVQAVHALGNPCSGNKPAAAIPCPHFIVASRHVASVAVLLFWRSGFRVKHRFKLPCDITVVWPLQYVADMRGSSHPAPFFKHESAAYNTTSVESDRFIYTPLQMLEFVKHEPRLLLQSSQAAAANLPLPTLQGADLVFTLTCG